MGCVSSRRDINDIHPNIFQVMNVDELGQPVSPGQLELTETELMLYQRGKTATRWPLRCLRRYGFDAEIFSFESGRRCPTGPGIYAFRCRRAEQLFNLVQQNIQLRNLSDDIVLVANELTIPAVSSGPPVSSRVPIEQSYLESVNNRSTRIQSNSSNRFSSSRPGSVTSNGPASPPSASSPTPVTSESSTTVPPAPAAENNNNKRILQYTNTVVDPSDNITKPYMNLEAKASPTLSSSSEPYAQLNIDDTENCHVYENVIPGKQDLDDRHCYANLNPGEIELNNPTTTTTTLISPTTLSISSSTTRKVVNYIVLDLEQSRTDSTGSGTSSSISNPVQPPDSPKRPAAKGYATIDFNKTVALSHSVNPCHDLDSEGSRKTRHNSTIGELAPILARHSTSLSD